MKSLNWRLITIVGLTLWALYAATPTFIYFAQPSDVKSNQELLQKKIPNWLPNKFINLGLDLQGGIQLVLGVNVDQAVENKLDRIATAMVRWAKDNNKPIETAYVLKNQGVLRVNMKPSGDSDEVRAELKKEFPGLEQVNRDQKTIDYRFETNQVKDIRASAIEQAERVIRSRVDKWGVAEPLIARRADKTILVQLPGFSDPEKAKSLLGRTAQLEFKIVDDAFTGFKELQTKPIPGLEVQEVATPDQQRTMVVFETEDQEAAAKAVAHLIPEDRLLLFEKNEIAGGKKSRYRSVVVFPSTEITGEDILDG